MTYTFNTVAHANKKHHRNTSMGNVTITQNCRKFNERESVLLELDKSLIEIYTWNNAIIYLLSTTLVVYSSTPLAG